MQTRYPVRPVTLAGPKPALLCRCAGLLGGSHPKLIQAAPKGTRAGPGIGLLLHDLHLLAIIKGNVVDSRSLVSYLQSCERV